MPGAAGGAVAGAAEAGHPGEVPAKDKKILDRRKFVPNNTQIVFARISITISLISFLCPGAAAADAGSVVLANLNSPIEFELNKVAKQLKPPLTVKVFVNGTQISWGAAQLDLPSNRIVVHLLGDPDDPKAGDHARQLRGMLQNSEKGNLSVCVQSGDGDCVERTISLNASSRWDYVCLGIAIIAIFLPCFVPAVVETHVRDAHGRRTGLARFSLTASIFYIWNFTVVVAVIYVRARALANG